jgi:Tfp pilus assembly protein PilW
VLRGQGGYTLAELLVVAAVVAFILSGMLSLIMSGSQSWVMGSNRVEAQQSTRLVLARLAQDVRTAGWDPRATSSFPSIRALPPGRTGFVVSNDWNATGAIETAAPVLVNGENRGEEITYEFVSGELRRQEAAVDASAVGVTGAIASIQFRYLNADDAQVNNAHQTTEANTIRTVEITVTTTPDQSGSAASTVHVTSSSRARVRNRS